MTRRSKDKVRVVVYLIVICAVLIASVGLSAYTAKLQCDLNSLNGEIRGVRSAVKGLEVKIKTASNITNIEERASELGFIYPDYDSIKYIKAGKRPIHDFALALIETAYR